MTIMTSTPSAAISRALTRKGVSRKGSPSGRKTLVGWGSNVSTDQGAPAAWAMRPASSITLT